MVIALLITALSVEHFVTLNGKWGGCTGVWLKNRRLFIVTSYSIHSSETSLYSTHPCEAVGSHSVAPNNRLHLGLSQEQSTTQIPEKLGCVFFCCCFFLPSIPETMSLYQQYNHVHECEPLHSLAYEWLSLLRMPPLIVFLSQLCTSITVIRAVSPIISDCSEPLNHQETLWLCFCCCLSSCF